MCWRSSKWDLVEDKQKVLAEVHSQLEDVLPEIRGVPVVTLSAKQERGVDKMMKAVFEAVDRWSARITTSQLNRWLEAAISKNPPPAPSGRRIKIRYATQASSQAADFCGVWKPDGENAGKLQALPDEHAAQGF